MRGMRRRSSREAGANWSEVALQGELTQDESEAEPIVQTIGKLFDVSAIGPPTRRAGPFMAARCGV